jgi:hypothetical protein
MMLEKKRVMVMERLVMVGYVDARKERSTGDKGMRG